MDKTEIIIISTKKYLYDILQQYNKYNLVWIEKLTELVQLKLINCHLIILDDYNYPIQEIEQYNRAIIQIVSNIKHQPNQNQLIKPIILENLINKINKITYQNNDNFIRLNQYYSFCYELKTIFEHDDCHIINLTEKETEIINYLVKEKHAVDKKKLLRHVWHYDESVDSHTVETHIYRLRQKLISDKELIVNSVNGYRIST